MKSKKVHPASQSDRKYVTDLALILSPIGSIACPVSAFSLRREFVETPRLKRIRESCNLQNRDRFEGTYMYNKSYGRL